MSKLLTSIKYLLAILSVAIFAVVAALAYYDFKHFQPAINDFKVEHSMVMPESLPKLLDSAYGDRLKYFAANVLLESNGKQSGHIMTGMWGSFVELHLTKKQQHHIVASGAYLGNHAVGFQQASEVFYHKKLSEITPKQMASLVVRLKAPSNYARKPERVKELAAKLLARAAYGRK